MPDTTIDQKKFTLTWKVAIPVMFSLLLISNTFTLQMVNIEENQKQTQRVEEAGRRRLANSEESTKKDNEIIFLKYQLNECAGE